MAISLFGGSYCTIVQSEMLCVGKMFRSRPMRCGIVGTCHSYSQPKVGLSIRKTRGVRTFSVRLHHHHHFQHHLDKLDGQNEHSDLDLRHLPFFLRIATAGLAIVQHTPIVLICSTTTNTLAFSSCSRLDHGGWGARRARTIWRTRLLSSRQHEARRLAK